ncbi:uncharacterized protein dome isoform X1 [Cherax quadricarinatus]
MMVLTWREGIPLALVALFTICQANDVPNYKCFPFSTRSQGKRSHDKSLSRHHRKWGNDQCPGPVCVAIEPTGDIIREVGKSYEAYCLFDPSQVRAEDVFFMHWEKTPNDQFRIPHTVVNESAISIQITHEEAVEYKLKCLTGNATFLCERTVKVGYTPKDVQNFTCISENWMKLNCTWAVPVNPVTVNYHLTYVVLGFLDSRECPKRQKGINECFWDPSEFNYRDNWVMIFEASNPLNEKGVQFKHEISVYENVLPNPPENLASTVIGPYEVELSWTLPHPIDVFNSTIYEVSYRKHQDGDQLEDVPWILVEQKKVYAQRSKELFTKVISDLHAYIFYDFRVRLHTGIGPIRQHMWSDPAIHTERTAATRPTKAPLTGIGTFEIEETLSHRDIYISWQKVDPLFWNGPNFTYVISVFNFQNDRPIIKSPEEIDIRGAYAKFTNMDKDIAYKFEIKPMNDEGLPGDEDVKSVVIVPEKGAILSAINYFKVIAYSSNSTVYSMRWRLPEALLENKAIESVSLYWCKKNKYEERCQNKLEWLTVEDLTITSKNLTDLDNSSLYMFGISVNSNNSSSGIKWHTCIANHGSRPPPLEQFEVIHVTRTKVTLKWNLDCKAKAAEPTGFNISYCTAAETEDKCSLPSDKIYETISDETSVEHLVKNLRPYTSYIFNIAILTEIGLSKWSNSARVQTLPDKPSGVPHRLKDTAKGQQWILLAWEPPLPEERNGQISEYSITVEPPVTPVKVKANSTSDVTMYNMTGLEPYTKYLFSVTPCTKGASCGDKAAHLAVRTKIGAPGKIDSIDQEDNQLEWEHDDCYAPECIYELRYRINGTEHYHRTSPSQLAISFEDLKIKCTEHQEELNIDLRAISVNEDNETLTGPWKEKKITCHIPGSYSYDRVPSIFVNPQITLVQLPSNNQYNTIFNILRAPYVVNQQGSLLNTDSLQQDPVMKDDTETNLETIEQVTPGLVNNWQTLLGNRVNELSWLSNTNARMPVMSSDETRQLLLKGGNKRVHPRYWSGILGDSEPQWNDVHFTRGLTAGQIENPILLNRDFTWRPWPMVQLGSINVHNTDNFSPLKKNIQSSASSVVMLPQYGFQLPIVSKNRMSLEENQSSDVRAQNNIKGNKGSHHKNSLDTGERSLFRELEAGHHDIISQENPEKLEISNSNSNCPLIELLRAKGVEINLTTSNDKFELNVRGHGGLNDLLQRMYHNSQARETVLDVTEIEPIMTNKLMVGTGKDTKENTSRKIIIDNDNDLLQQHTSEPKENSTVTVQGDHTVLTILPNSRHTSTADLTSTHSMEESTPNPNFQKDSPVTFNFDYMHMENETDLISVPSSSPTSGQIDSSSHAHGQPESEFVHAESMIDPLMPKQEKTRNGTESVKQIGLEAATEASRSRRSPEALSSVLIKVPLNNQLSDKDHLQGRHSSFNVNKVQENLEVSSGTDKQIVPVIENITESSVGNENTTSSKDEEVIGESVMMPDLEDIDMGHQMMESSHPRVSTVYHLGLMGLFDGNVGKIAPLLTNRHTITLAESLSEASSNISFTSNVILRPSSLPDVNLEPGGKEPLLNIEVNGHQNKFVSSKISFQSDCPFGDLLASQDTKIHVNTLEDGGFELKLQGNGSFYDLVKQIFHTSDAITDNLERNSFEKETTSLNNLMNSAIKKREKVLKVHVTDNASNDSVGETNLLDNNSGLPTAASADENSYVFHAQANSSDNLNTVEQSLITEQFHKTEEQLKGVTTEATMHSSASDILLLKHTTGREVINETYMTSTEMTPGKQEEI